MFASGGYFRSANCPFFKHGLCHRPYCHFRHTKPEYKPSSIASSVPVSVGEKGISKLSTNREPKSHKNKDKNILNKGKDKDSGKLSKKDVKENEVHGKNEQPFSNPLFKRTALEEKLIANAGDMDDILSDSDSDSEKVESSKQNEIKVENSDSVSASDNISNNGQFKNIDVLGVEKNSPTKTVQLKDDKVEPLATIDDTLINTDDSLVKKEDNLRSRDSEAENTSITVSSINGVTSQKAIEQHDSDITNHDTSSNKPTIVNENLGVLIDDLQKYGKGYDVNFQSKKEQNKVQEKDRSQVEAPQLADVTFFSPIVVKRKSKKRRSENHFSDKTVTKTDEKNSDKNIAKDKKKTVKDLSAVKTSSNKEKSRIQRYKELKKLVKGSKDSEKKLAGQQSVMPCNNKQDKMMEEVEENVNDDENEESELLRIFNDYNPCDEPDIIDITEPVINLSGNNSTVTCSTSSGSVKRPASDKVAVGFKKQRVAHQASHIIQRPTGPMPGPSKSFRRLPRPLQGTLMPSTQTTRPQTQPQGDRDLVISTHVKQRVTHYTKAAGTLVSRPRIRLEFGAKVPQTVRQKYLDKLVDEYLLECENQQEAFDRAEKEERAIYEKSPRRQMYINLCVNRIKKLRDADENKDDSEKRNPLVGKSSLPSPPKRLKMDNPTISLSQNINHPEIILNNQPEKMKSDDGITEEVFYARLKKYLLTEEEMVSNGFPRPSVVPGYAEINDTYGKIKKSLGDPTRRICCRCGKPFVILESGEYQNKEECVFHHGRLLRRRTAGELVTAYTCCQGETGCIGCSVAKAHVRAIDWSEESNFVTTIQRIHGSTEKVFALDCEMCYTTKGLELTRVTVVDYKSQKVYDSLVKPDNVILDYNTRFSGITEEILTGVTTTLHDVQIVLLSLLSKDTILLGHSLESDLKALRIIHSSIVDTSIVFPHRLGLPYKRALRTLMGEYVQKIIQNNEEGHDSLEDAASCIELMLWKVKEDMKIKERKKNNN